MKYTAVLFITAFLVYSLKAFRFYFLLVGEGIPFLKYVGVFSRTTFVNIILPFKTGEIFRIYSFGRLTENYLKGFSVVILDRFIDIISILSIFIFMKLAMNIKFEGIFFLLAGISLFLALCYLILPGLLYFWSSYFIESKASLRHLKGLVFIKKVKGIYGEIKSLLQGRFFLLFTLSLLSWGVEIFPLLIFADYVNSDKKLFFAKYLSSALSGNDFAPQRSFAMSSMIFLATVYFLVLIFTVIKILIKKRERKNG